MSIEYSSVSGDGASTEVGYKGAGLRPAIEGETYGPPDEWDQNDTAAYLCEIFEVGDGVDGPFYQWYADEATLARKLMQQRMSLREIRETVRELEPPITNVGLTVSQIINKVLVRNDSWPRVVGNTLFVDDPVQGIAYFDRHATDSFFGWLRSHHSVVWKNSGAGRGEVVAELERTAERYDSVEELPHEPQIDGIYYRGKAPEAGDGNRLKWLLKRFNPETTIDGDLIKAAFMTPMWGGPPGKRPIFAITSDAGRGVGKSTLVEIISYLYGGHFDVSCGSDIEQLKSRLLSPDARTKRLALIDNVKSMKLSWAELEAMVTAPVISGRQLYRGEGQRPNLLCWFATVNGPAMAPDLAQRSVIVKLAKADYSGSWLGETYEFIDKYRSEIIGDIIAALRADKFPLQKFTRWGSWEADVLQRLPEPGEAQALILERQGQANVEVDEVEFIEDFFAAELARLGYDPDTEEVRIPSAIATDWYKKATGDFKNSNNAISIGRKLQQMIGEGQIKRLYKDPSRKKGRAFIWTGENFDCFVAERDDLQEQIDKDRERRSGDGWWKR